MVLDQALEFGRVNAKPTDAFDVFNIRHYAGPNPYLETMAVVFDFALVQGNDRLAIADYVAAVGDRYSQLCDGTFDSYAHLFAHVVLAVSHLDMNLHFQHCRVMPQKASTKIAIEALHARTSRAVIYTVWDWFEAITQAKTFWLEDQIEVLQTTFRNSVYGGPTVYALWQTALRHDIPAFYLWDEGLMQYGYGKKQVRGVATTFDRDSHLDSDFTTRKDDCKAFLDTLGFPVPKGEVVYKLSEALKAGDRVGYPVAVKPVSGHKGNGVTAAVQTPDELEQAFDRAVAAIPPEQPIRIIVEQSITGKDYRLLCVNGRFVAATERRPASVTGDGTSTIQALIERENRSPARIDTPTSPLGKIKTDEAMERYLEEQGLSLDDVLERDQTIYLRKVANLSSGGLSIDATGLIHPDNIILAQDVAQYFQLTCLGIDVVAQDIAQSWKDGNFSIIEINAAPGIYMHLNPAIGESVDVPAHILKTFFDSGASARIPIISFNQLPLAVLPEIIDHILLHHPDWTIGAVCQDGVLINRSTKNRHPDYNANIQNLLRNSRIDLLIAEYREEILERYGMFYDRSDLVILNDPTPTEMMLTRNVSGDSTIVTKQDTAIAIQRSGLIERYEMGPQEPFSRVYLKEIAAIL